MAIFRTGDATRVWTAGGRGLDLSMRWEWEMIPTRKDLLIYGARSLRSLAPLSRAGLYKTDPDDRPRERSERGENFGDVGVR